MTQNLAIYCACKQYSKSMKNLTVLLRNSGGLPIIKSNQIMTNTPMLESLFNNAAGLSFTIKHTKGSKHPNSQYDNKMF